MKINKDSVHYEIRVRPDDIPVRGNAMASGDDELDCSVEDEIISRLSRGDIWAWCCVCVAAVWEDENGNWLVGHDYLGACSYRDEDDFKACTYYSDMKEEAFADLLQKAESIAAALEE